MFPSARESGFHSGTMRRTALRKCGHRMTDQICTGFFPEKQGSLDKSKRFSPLAPGTVTNTIFYCALNCGEKAQRIPGQWSVSVM